jgi:hypothetical protein
VLLEEVIDRRHDADGLVELRLFVDAGGLLEGEDDEYALVRPADPAESGVRIDGELLGEDILYYIDRICFIV